MAQDLQCIVGNVMEPKVRNVINLTECAQWYGANKATKMVQGIMTAIDVIENVNTNLTTMLITVAYDLSGISIKSARLNA